MVDLINPPDDMEARRQEARRRRANREGLDLGEPVQDIDAIEETRRRSAPPPPAPFDAPPPPAGEEAPGRLVEFRKKDKKKKEQELRPEEDTYPGALPVPEVSKSRLISRLGEIKKSVAAKQAGKKKKSAFNLTFWTFAVAVLIPAVQSAAIDVELFAALDPRLDVLATDLVWWASALKAARAG